MNGNLVLLAILMFAVTYPFRALGLVTPGMDRLPKIAFDYLQLVGPAVLAALVMGGCASQQGASPPPRPALGPDPCTMTNSDAWERAQATCACSKTW